MSNLTKKDATFNWHAPKSSKRDYSTNPNRAVLKNIDKSDSYKYTQKHIDFKKAFLDKHCKYAAHVYKMAVSFDEERLLVTFNPAEGVPYYKLSKNGTGRALNNINLIDEIYKYFGLPVTTQKYYLNFIEWAKVNNMQLYTVQVLDYDTKEEVQVKKNFKADVAQTN